MDNPEHAIHIDKIVVKQSARVWHQGIAPNGPPVAFLAGEAVVGNTDTAVAGTAIGKVPFIRDDGIALIGGQDRAA